jgi:hypothetical protein
VIRVGHGNRPFFLKLLPEKKDGERLRHVLEFRHQSFVVRNSSRCSGSTGPGLSLAEARYVTGSVLIVDGGMTAI